MRLILPAPIFPKLALPILAGLVAIFAAGPTAAGAERLPGSAIEITVTLSTYSVSTFTGDSVTITSEIRNPGPGASPPLVANLNFVSLDGKTFVDPEDWSRQRTVQLPSIASGSSITQSWTIVPVLKGEIAAYVVILPAPYELASAGPAASSPALHLHVTERRTLNPRGVLPVVLAVPGLLGLLTAYRRWTRDRV